MKPTGAEKPRQNKGGKGSAINSIQKLKTIA
jgi:hypothetical protein